MAEVYYTPDAIEQNQLNWSFSADNIKSDRKPEDLLFQVLLDWGVESVTTDQNKSQSVEQDYLFCESAALRSCSVLRYWCE